MLALRRMDASECNGHASREDGAAATSEAKELDRPTRELQSPAVERQGLRFIHHRMSVYHCTRQSAQPERMRWHGDGPQCHTFNGATHPHTGDFQNAFSQRDRRTQIMLLGDSIGYQALSAVYGAAHTNPHLRELRFGFASGEAAWPGNPFNMRYVPRTVNGSLWLLHSIKWDSNAHRRVVLASSGNWYNQVPACSMRPNAGCEALGSDLRNGHPPRDVGGDRPYHCTLGPNLTRLKPESVTGNAWDACGNVRAWMGSTTPLEYRSDMANFAVAVQQWVQEVPNASVVWLEYTPQHITPGAGVTSAGGCSSAPVPPLPPRYDDWPEEARAMCKPAEVSHTPGNHGAAFSEECVLQLSRRYGNWANDIARHALSKAGIPVVPLWQALASRSDLHVGTTGRDCTHWCSNSEAGLHIARAVLGVLMALSNTAPDSVGQGLYPGCRRGSQGRVLQYEGGKYCII